MKAKYVLLLAVDNIKHRKLRSWLTILGIVIGVASIVSLISISLGVSNEISERMNTLGSNIIQISAGSQQAQRFMGPGPMSLPGQNSGLGKSIQKGGEITFREADELRTLPGVYKLDARLQDRNLVYYQNKNASLNIIGTEPQSFKESVGANLFSGRYLSTSDQYSAVLGYNVANSTFNDFDMLNKQIKIGDDRVIFRVVGILEKTGGTGGTDNSIFIPQKTAKTLFNETKAASQIIVVVSENHDIEEVVSSIEKTLLNLHMVSKSEKDFQIVTAATLQSAVSGVSDTLGLLLAGIASISLIVGGIGVANTMFMSVLEQTKDIGVLKSIGAKEEDVIFLFLTEAGIIGLIGGIFGILLSFLASFALSIFNVPTMLTMELLLGGLLFSIFIGILAGIAPARSAAKIPPIEALRYE